jgi:hypothetical protein
MYCPQCGQLQVSDVTRFCSRCGFLLEGVTTVLASGGTLPTRYVHPSNRKLSPRSKGVRQGALMMLSTLLIVPLLAIVFVGILGGFEMIVPFAAISLFVGGLLRILYALLMEDAAPQLELEPPSGYAPPSAREFERSSQSVLPPATANPPAGWRPRQNTAEIYQAPPSITEGTTRLLKKDEPETR